MNANKVQPINEPVTPNIPPPTMTSTKRVVRIRQDALKVPKLDEAVEDTTEKATETDSDTSFHTRDAEITDETLTSSSNSPDTTVPEEETAMAEENEDKMQTEENSGGNINPIRRSRRTSKKINKMGGLTGKTLNGDNLLCNIHRTRTGRGGNNHVFARANNPHGGESQEKRSPRAAYHVRPGQGSMFQVQRGLRGGNVTW